MIRPVDGLLSYTCARDGGALDRKFTRQADQLVFAQNRFNGQVLGGGLDAILAAADVVNLKGVGSKLANKLRGASIDTIAEFAAADWLGSGISLSKREAGVISSLQGRLQACAGRPARMVDSPNARAANITAVSLEGQTLNVRFIANDTAHHLVSDVSVAGGAIKVRIADYRDPNAIGAQVIREVEAAIALPAMAAGTPVLVYNKNGRLVFSGTLGG